MLSLALIVLAQTSAPEDFIRPPRLERVQRAGGRGGPGLAWFEAFPASGAGLVSAGNLCDQLQPSEKAGNWWCWDAASGSASGGLSLPQVGGTRPPVQQSSRTCPNGPDCTAVTEYRFTDSNTSGATGRDGWETASTYADPSGAFSVWGVVSAIADPNVTFGAQNIVAQAETGASIDFLWQLDPNSTILRTYIGGASRNTTTLTPGAWHHVCLTSDGARGATSGRFYLDGVQQGGTFSTAPAAYSNQVWRISGYGDGTFPMSSSSRLRNAGFSETELSGARCAELARAALADAPTGARGEALSETRASVQFCESSDGTGTLLPNNRPCITRGGTTAAQGAFTQSLLQTEALGNAAWADVATPTITSDSIVSAGGTLTADTVDDNNAAAFEGRSQTVTVTAATAYTMSCYAKAGTLAKIRLSLDGTTGDTTTLSSSSWTRVFVTDASTSGVAVSAQVLAGTATTDTGTVYVWGCNVTPGSSLRPYIPATSAAVTTGAEVPYLTLTNAPALNSIEATVDTPATYAATARVMSVYKDATNAFDMYVDTTAANKLNCLATVGGVTYSGLSSGAVSASASHRLSCSYDGTNVIACVDGTCNSTARSFTMFSAATRVYLGTYATTGAEINPTPVINGVKADPNGARFR